MKIALQPAALISATVAADWQQLRRDRSCWDSPFFHPDFARCVGQVREDTQTALIEDDGRPAGFFSFQRDDRGRGLPAAHRLSDFHGIVARPGLNLTAEELLRGCRLQSWQFDHSIDEEGPLSGGEMAEHTSPWIDLTAGIAAYETYLRQQASASFSNADRKKRKMERELGAVRFDWHVADAAVLRTLLDWKAEQQQEQGVRVSMRWPWVQELLARLHGRREDDALSGLLAVITVDGKLLAAHFGLRDRDVLHWWVTAYDHAFAAYSPGMVLTTEFIREAAAQGVRRIDLGKGQERYKLSLSNGASTVREGIIARPGLTRWFSTTSRRAKIWLENSPRAELLRSGKRIIRRWASG